MALTDAQRAQLGAIADQLIPAGGGMPSASEAGVSGQYLDEVLNSLPDLGDALDTTLAAVDGLDPAEAIAVLRQDPAGWGVLTAVVPGAYFMNPAIREAIGYPGLERRPIDPNAEPDYLADGLLDSVVSRGPVYRPTPTD
ncbi:gluconate 2-dehydrogenase subunit 3 family protein [Solirubrobacter taibaiensis]|nr:gluconate 2-dehydrogenase subunit 3 family protein [Solirubrobacter taibaiensis]